MFVFRHNDVCPEQHQTSCLGLRIGSVLPYVISSIIYKLITECLDLNRSTKRIKIKIPILYVMASKNLSFYWSIIFVIKLILGPFVQYFVICYEECQQSEHITRNVCNFVKRMLNKKFTDLTERRNALLRKPNLLSTEGPTSTPNPAVPFATLHVLQW